MRKRMIAGALAALGAFVYFNNASWLGAAPRGRLTLLAHRGVHQIYVGPKPDGSTCTARPIADPTHAFIENTIPSFRAAFDAGADVVELDIHPTTDDHLVVFHDWTLDCRTDGTGVTREHSLAELKRLDVGYGYATRDGAFPLRGTGVGAMPTLSEVLDAFPEARFLVNFKGNDPRDAELLADLLRARGPETAARIAVYGGRRPTDRIIALMPGVRGYTRHRLKRCALGYATLGWTGYVARPCRHTILVVPRNVAPWVWGWPHRFTARMSKAGTGIFLIGDYHRGDRWSGGLDDVAVLDALPPGYSGGLWTDRIERIGPAFRCAEASVADGCRSASMP